MSDSDFWRLVYAAAIAAGRCNMAAARAADAALDEHRERFGDGEETDE